jgi:hypothetical protein
VNGCGPRWAGAAIPTEGKIMRFKGSTARHGRVIDQAGNALDDTVRFPRLHAVSEIVLRRLEPEEPVSRLLHDGTPTRILPVHGHDTIVMRVPSAPQQPRPSRARDLVRVGFQMTARALDEKVRWLTASWMELARDNDRKAADLDARLERMVRRQHEWAATEDGRALEEAYREGGTERLLKLTPTVLAAMDARAKEMAR